MDECPVKSAGRLVVLLLAVTVTSCGNDSGTDATDGTAAAADRSTSPGTSGGDWRDVPTGETNIDDIDPIPTGVDGVAAIAGPGATIELEDGVTLSCEADEFFFQVEGSELPLCGTSPEEMAFMVSPPSTGDESGTDATDGTAAAADRSTSPGTSGGDWRDVPTGETNIDDIDPVPTGVDGVAAVAGPGATIELEDGVTLSCEADEFFFQVEGSELPLCGTSPEEMAFMVSPPST